MSSAFHVPAHFTTVDEVVDGLSSLERKFRFRNDRCGVFATTYFVSTLAIREHLARGGFRNPTAVANYITAYANRYRQALADHAHGRPRRVPTPWRMAFGSAATGTAPLLQDLLLGINAHVNFDLPLAALEAGLDVDCDCDYRDHTRINDALRSATPKVRRRVIRMYQPSLLVPGTVGGPLIDRMVMSGFERARERAWRFARSVATSRSPAESAAVGRMIQSHAEGVARRIVINVRSPFPYVMRQAFDSIRLRRHECEIRSGMDSAVLHT